MKDFFGNIYSWFESFFGRELSEHLWGYECETGTYLTNLYNQVGWVTLLISLLCAVLFYYVINHPRFNRWWSWVIMLLVNGLINFYYAFQFTLSDFNSGKISDCLMYIRNEDTGEVVSKLITEANCTMFGYGNFIISTLFFVIISFIIKWKSRNAKHAPFL